MSGLVYKVPTNVEMDVTTQEYVRDHTKMKGETILPVVEKFTQNVEWDEKDNETGMTPPHNMDTDPKTETRPGSKLKSYKPIPHKATELIKESELLNARQLGTLGGVVNLDDLVMDRFTARIGKDHVRKEWEIWQALKGSLSINENDVIINETFPIQEHAPLVPLDDLEDATPLAERNAIKLKFRGTGASAQGAVEYLNQTTANAIIENKNNADLRGFVVDNFRAASFDIEQYNKMMTARGLPILEIYDEGYYDDAGNFQLFIPDGVSIIVGKRPAGQTVGDFCLTPSLHRQKNGMPAPGFFAFISVNGQPNPGGTVSVSLEALGAAGNPKIGVTSGFYGGPRLIYPRSIIKVNNF